MEAAPEGQVLLNLNKTNSRDPLEQRLEARSQLFTKMKGEQVCEVSITDIFIIWQLFR